MKRTRFFTLMEVLLSLALFALLLNALFFWYKYMQLSNSESQKHRWPVLEERFAKQQLENIIPLAADHPIFFTSKEGVNGESLVFLFDNGIQSEALLSDQVLGRLFIDHDTNTLCLGIWPHPKYETQSPHQTLILMKNVSDLKFHFYFPKDPFKKPVDPKEVGKVMPAEGWQQSWLADYKTLPPLMKIEMEHSDEKRGSHPLIFAFELLYSSHPILYKKEIGA